MANHQEIIKQVSEYAAKAGTSPEAVCRSATKNPRLWPRLLARIDTVEKDLGRLEAHMKSNPIVEDAKRHDEDKRGSAANGLQDSRNKIVAP